MMKGNLFLIMTEIQFLLNDILLKLEPRLSLIQKKKLFDENEKEELVDLTTSFTPQKVEFMKAGGSYAVVFGKKLQNFASKILNVKSKPVFAPSKNISIPNQGLTAVEKILMLILLVLNQIKFFTLAQI